MKNCTCLALSIVLILLFAAPVLAADPNIRKSRDGNVQYRMYLYAHGGGDAHCEGCHTNRGCNSFWIDKGDQAYCSPHHINPPYYWKGWTIDGVNPGGYPVPYYVPAKPGTKIEAWFIKQY